MPSITPSYLYTIIALIAVSSLLVLSFMAYTDAFRFSSELKQLKNLMDYVAAKGTELLTLAIVTNATAETFLQMPTAIGNKQYWLQLCNDSAKAWLEGGFGNMPMKGTELRVYIPKKTSAEGYYMGSYGAALLKCEASSETPQIILTSSSEGE